MESFGADEDDVEGDVGEHVRELAPDVAGEGGFCAGADDEDAHWWWEGFGVFDLAAGAGWGWVEGVSGCYEERKMEFILALCIPRTLHKM